MASARVRVRKARWRSSCGVRLRLAHQAEGLMPSSASQRRSRAATPSGFPTAAMAAPLLVLDPGAVQPSVSSAAGDRRLCRGQHVLMTIKSIFRVCLRHPPHRQLLRHGGAAADRGDAPLIAPSERPSRCGDECEVTLLSSTIPDCSAHRGVGTLRLQLIWAQKRTGKLPVSILPHHSTALV